MRFWLTTQWPYRINEPADKERYGVWLQDGQLVAVEDMAVGDQVLVYEFATAPVVFDEEDGTCRPIPCRRGRQGIVAILEVTDLAEKHQRAKPPEDYDDGRRMWWRYCAPTKCLDASGFVPKSEILRVLGMSLGSNLRGIGRLHSGVLEITRAQFDHLANAFRASG